MLEDNSDTVFSFAELSYPLSVPPVGSVLGLKLRISVFIKPGVRFPLSSPDILDAASPVTALSLSSDQWHGQQASTFLIRNREDGMTNSCCGAVANGGIPMHLQAAVLVSW